MPQATVRNGFNQHSNAAKSGRKQQRSASLLRLLSQFAHGRRFGGSDGFSDVACEYANDHNDQNHIDCDRQFGNYRQVGCDCDAGKKGAILHGKDADHLGEGFTPCNQGICTDKDPARPMGRFAWITGSSVIASMGLTRNSAAIASRSASNKEKGMLMTWSISRRS